jgi:hypothetical protein
MYRYVNRFTRSKALSLPFRRTASECKSFVSSRPAESKLADKPVEHFVPVRLRQGYSATVFGSPLSAREEWSLGIISLRDALE